MTTSSTTTPDNASAESAIATLPPVECTSWCRAGDGHPDALFPGDQWCSTEGRVVYLGAEKLERYDENNWVRADVTVTAQRDAYAARALVHLSHNGLTSVKFTADEARELANALLVLASAAEHA